MQQRKRISFLRLVCGLVYEAGNTEEYVKNMITLYQDPEKRSKLGGSGKEFITQKFNWEITGKTLVKLYEDLEKKHREDITDHILLAAGRG